MSEQSYATHAHQPAFTLAAGAFWLLALIGLVASALGYPGWGRPLAVSGIMLAVLCLISISRVYTTRLQDRIILLEERLRAERLLTPTQRADWDRLGIKQVVALRFASDQEFASLLERTRAEGLPPDAIKRAVTQWRADTRRT